MLIEASHFIDPETCSQLRSAYDASSPEDRQKSCDAPIYPERLGSQARALIRREINRMRRFFEISLKQNLYVETVVLACIRDGYEMPAHADNCRRLGHAWVPNHTPDRAFSAIVYLNGEGIRGGEIHFPDRGIKVKPETGKIVAFTSNQDYVHEVLRVEGGHRYSMPVWYTLKADRALVDFHEAEVNYAVS